MKRAAALAALVGLGFLCWPVDPGLLEDPAATRVLDRNGRELAVRAPEEGQGADFGALLPAMTLAAEDHRFRWHPGIDPVGVARAAWHDLQAGEIVEGGSSIDQQLARNLQPRAPGLLGKLGEAGLALRLRWQLGTNEVLHRYLSRVFYGNGAIGADAAARLYFDRPPATLSLAQAAALAAIPQRPSALDPMIAPERVQAARDRVLDRALRYGFASQEDVDAARAEPLRLSLHGRDTLAPHFVRRVTTGAAVVQTTLDLGLQEEAEAAVRDALDDLAGHGARHAAVIVVENRTREVRAYVGSGEWGAADGQVDGVMAARSPGSALKPFVYELALERGMTLADVVADVPGAWKTTHGSWRPTNYGEQSMGPVTLREALANSLNVPAVRIAERVGAADIHHRLRQLGATTLTERPDHYGLGLTLGDAEMRLDELAAAYAALASGGRWRPLRFRDTDPKAIPQQVMDPQAAWLILDALDDPDARAAAFGHDSVLEADYPMAAKTGTSTGYRDNWAFGVTPSFTVGVWVGNFDATGMVEVSGIAGAGPILRHVMDAAMRGAPRADFDRPDGLVQREVCPLSGGLRGATCPATRAEWFRRSDDPAPCSWHGADGVTLPAEYAGWDRGGHTTGDRVAIAYPSDGAVFWLDPDRDPDDQAIPLRPVAASGDGRWLVDGREIARTRVARWVPNPGDHTVAYEIGGVRSSPITVRVATGR